MVKANEQPAATAVPNESVTTKAHGQPKAPKQSKDPGKTASHGKTPVVSESYRSGRWMGTVVLAGVVLAVALRSGRRWWSGRSGATGEKSTVVRDYVDKLRTLAARLGSYRKAGPVGV